MAVRLARNMAHEGNSDTSDCHLEMDSFTLE